ncbi:MAG: M23 family metallopeptidase [Bacteroidetes bacterium]|nr:M23 family metallopeptidase [Bacteroidota bacterium]
MPELSAEQVDQVQAKLHQVGLEFRPLEDEFLDHLCCAIEQNMGAGMTFAEAEKSAFAAFGEDEMKKLESETISIINKNSNSMKNMLVSLAAGLLLVLVTFISLKAEPPYLSPVPGDFKISSGFGWRVHPIFKEKKMHKGIDIPAPLGTDIVATSAGVVEEAGFSEKGYGYYVLIRHDDHYQSLYGQMTSDLQVEAGQKVKAGELIGYVGSSGRSTAPHLHYEVILDGEHVDPQEYMGM